jgi:hypothetical protein
MGGLDERGTGRSGHLHWFGIQGRGIASLEVIGIGF